MKLDVRYLIPGKAIPTGPDTDALIAEYVLGLDLMWAAGDTRVLAKARKDGSRHLFPYSAEEWAAGDVLKHGQENGWGLFMFRDSMGVKGRRGWYECNMTGGKDAEGKMDTSREAFAYQPTTHQAICQGALIRVAREAAERGELEVVQPAGGV